MSQNKTGTGSCLCGAVKVFVEAFTPNVDACHCGMCRKFSSGPFLAIDCGKDVSFSGEANISVYNSSDWAERGFCKKCGSKLFYRFKKNNHYFLSAGLFDPTDDFTFVCQVFTDDKPKYYNFAEKTKMLTSDEVFAQFDSE